MVTRTSTSLYIASQVAKDSRRPRMGQPSHRRRPARFHAAVFLVQNQPVRNIPPRHGPQGPSVATARICTLYVRSGSRSGSPAGTGHRLSYCVLEAARASRSRLARRMCDTRRARRGVDNAPPCSAHGEGGAVPSRPASDGRLGSPPPPRGIRSARSSRNTRGNRKAVIRS
jgi:hypothetical protein